MKWWIVYCDSNGDAEYKNGDMISETGPGPDGKRPDSLRLTPHSILVEMGRREVEVDIPDDTLTTEERRTGRPDFGLRRWDPTTLSLVLWPLSTSNRRKKSSRPPPTALPSP